MRGAYEFGESDLAVVDLTYVIDAGAETVESRIVSDGERAVLVSDDEVVDVPPEQAKALRVGEGSAPGVPALDLTSWVKDPELNKDGDRTEVRGVLRAAPFIADLQRVAASIGAGGTGSISGVDADRLEKAVTRSDVVVVTRGDDHELRSLRATVEFGANVPRELRDALGSYAGARLSLTLDVEDVKTPLDVELPD